MTIPGLEIKEVHLDSYSGQHNLSLRAHLGGEVVGFLDYSVFRGKAHIDLVEVSPEHRRSGIARDLVDRLYRQFGRRGVEWGWVTESGGALRTSVAQDWRLKSRQEKAGMARLKTLLERRKQREGLGGCWGGQSGLRGIGELTQIQLRKLEDPSLTDEQAMEMVERFEAENAQSEKPMSKAKRAKVLKEVQESGYDPRFEVEDHDRAGVLGKYYIEKSDSKGNWMYFEGPFSTPLEALIFVYEDLQIKWLTKNGRTEDQIEDNLRQYKERKYLKKGKYVDYYHHHFDEYNEDEINQTILGYNKKLRIKKIYGIRPRDSHFGSVPGVPGPLGGLGFLGLPGCCTGMLMLIGVGALAWMGRKTIVRMWP